MNVLVDARANIKQQTWTVGPFQELTLNKLWKFGRRIVKTLCTYFQFNSIKCIIYLYNLYNITFRLTNVIPERIIFVSRGITVFSVKLRTYIILFYHNIEVTFKAQCGGFHTGLIGRGQLKCDGTRAETRFRLSAKRTSQFKSAGGVSSVNYWQPRCAHQR